MADRANRPRLDAQGKYPACAWPGGNTLIYLGHQGSVLCADCASPTFPIQDTLVGRETIVACEVYDEGPPIACDECGTTLESSYGNPDEENEPMDSYQTLARYADQAGWNTESMLLLACLFIDSHQPPTEFEAFCQRAVQTDGSAQA